jgi:TonB family protein
MKRAWMMAAGGLFALSLMAGVWVKAQSSGGAGYHAAAVAQAGSIPYPMNSRAPGFVTLDVSLDASGTVQNVTVVRDVPPLTAAAQGAVKNWQFTAATADGQAAPGAVPVDVAFNPYNPSGVGLSGETLQPPSSTLSGDFQPAALVKANYAVYPPNTVASGTVVMMVRVGSDGSVHRVRVLRGKGVLVDAATAAVKTWGFTPATYKGSGVGADVAVAFVFASPQAGTR